MHMPTEVILYNLAVAGFIENTVPILKSQSVICVI